jgi:hypothetical protein
MNTAIEALFDGTVFRPTKPFTLEPNTRVWITVETDPPKQNTKPSFLQTAFSLNLDGPADWSLNLENYLYGSKIYEESHHYSLRANLPIIANYTT